jgi:succinate-semialdehyde dehydrogenase / glutarate-semialdehyde dehydrogenase
VNIVTGKAGPIAESLFSHPAVRVVSFTGSTETGKDLIRNSAAGVKRLSLELGGNAPFIVFDDADLERAADELMLNKFRGSGQTCVCANRVYVHQAVAEKFEKAVVDRVSHMKVGDGMDPKTDIGPLINRDGFDKVARHVQDAMSKGARRLFGQDMPRPEHEWGCFCPPTVLAGVTPDMLALRDETFGPLIAIAEFSSEDPVIQQANQTGYGLAAYVFSNDTDRLKRVARNLLFGHVGLNTGTGPTPEAPFGGMKESGFGREGGIEGLHEFIEVQTVAHG